MRKTLTTVKSIIYKYQQSSLSIKPCSVSMYRGLNHHGSLISQCFDNVQWEHRPTLIQQSQSRFHGDQNTCPSNPSAERVIQNKHSIECTVEGCTVCASGVQLEFSLCVCACVHVTCSVPLVALHLSFSPWLSWWTTGSLKGHRVHRGPATRHTAGVWLHVPHQAKHVHTHTHKTEN